MAPSDKEPLRDSEKSFWTTFWATLWDALRGTSITITDLSTPALSSLILEILDNRFFAALATEPRSDIRERAARATEHLEFASSILSDLQIELQEKKNELDGLMTSIEAKQSEAQKWERLAAVKRDLAQDLSEEIKARLRSELERKERVGRLARLTVGLLTLILGAVLGILAQEVWNSEWLLDLFSQTTG